MSRVRLGRLAPTIALFLLIGASARQAEYEWDIPAPFPKPPVPPDNPMSAVKVELGRRLFYDKRMSVTGDRSCASCHQQLWRSRTGEVAPWARRESCTRAAA